MVQRVHLNGGPWHGRDTIVQDDRDHFHIIEPVEDVIARELGKAHDAPDDTGFHVARTREGTYSQVQGVPGEYEWDGWVSHD